MSSKRHQVSEAGNISVPDSEFEKCDHMLSQLDAVPHMTCLTTYYSTFVGLLSDKYFKCVSCRSALLLDPNDPHARSQLQFPQYAKFTLMKQCGGLILPSMDVFKIVKLTEQLFKKIVLMTKTGISFEKNIELQIQYTVLKALDRSVFPSMSEHFFDHTIGEEYDHVTSLLSLVVQKYLNMRLKTYAKKYSEMIVHKNMPSTRHQLTKLILFRNQ